MVCGSDVEKKFSLQIFRIECQTEKEPVFVAWNYVHVCKELTRIPLEPGIGLAVQPRFKGAGGPNTQGVQVVLLAIESD